MCVFVAMVAVATANEEVLETMEKGGVRSEANKEEELVVLLQPLVDGGVIQVAGAAMEKPSAARLASLDVFRGLSIAVCCQCFEDEFPMFLELNPVSELRCFCCGYGCEVMG